MDIKTAFKTTALCLALGSMGISGTALANSVQLNISGTVKASPCEVENNGKKDVELETIEAADMAAPESAGKFKPFEVVLKNCPGGTKRVIATFSGRQAKDNLDMYENIAEATTAAGSIQIHLTDDSEKITLKNGTQMEVKVGTDPDAPTSAIFKLKARTYTTKGGVTPGSIAGAVQMNLVYEGDK